MKTLTVDDAQAIFRSSWGSERTYKRAYCNSLVYTTGVYDIQEKLSACWLVDMVISYMPEIAKIFNNVQETFFVVQVVVNPDNTGYFEIYREGYEDNEKYNEHITVVKQDIPYIDLPTSKDEEVTYKLYLELACDEPMVYMLLQTSEH